MVNLTLPIYWVNEKKTKKSTTHLVGENFFRNACYHIKNKMKKDYHELVHNQIVTQPKQPYEKFVMHYKLFYKNPSSDPSNVVSKIEKFVLDALKAEKVIVDDNVMHHTKSSYEVVGQDKENPRVEITVTEKVN